MGHIFLVAGNPIERLSADDIEPTRSCICQEPNYPHPIANAHTGNGLVTIAANDLPSLPLSKLAAEPELIINRLRVLFEPAGLSC